MLRSPPRPLSARAHGLTSGRGVAILSALILLTGCAETPAPKTPLASASGLATTTAFTAPVSDWPADDWWTAYGDTQLSALIAEGLARSPNVRETAARLRLAEAATGQARTAFSPTIGASASVNEYLQSKTLGFPREFAGFLPGSFHPMGRATLDFAYDLDLFGKNRANLAAAISETDAARADKAQGRLTIATSIAVTYADLRRLTADRAAAVAAVEVRKKTLDLVGQRLNSGLETRGEYRLQAASVPAARVEVDQLDRQIALTRNALAALLGAGPDRGQSIEIPVSAPTLKPFGLPQHLALDLVGRRPDLTAARLRASAAATRIKAAHADFYPNIDISGSVGYQSLGLEKLVYDNSRTGQFGPALHLPIFSGGRASQAQRGASARYEQAAAQYDQTLVLALKDVADAAVNIRLLDRQLADARESLGHSEEAYRIAVARYEGGLSPFLSVLTSENNLISQRRAVADLEGLAFTLDIALVRALGGGVQPPAPPVRTSAR